MNKLFANPQSSKARLIDNFLSLYLLQGLNYLIPMAVFPYLLRVLGVGTYGLVAFSQAFAQYFIILTDYGFNLSATRHIAKNRNDANEVRAMFWQVMIIKAALGFLGIAILALVVLLVPRFRHDSPFFLCAYIVVIGNILFPQWYFQGMEKMRYISAVTGTAKIISACLLFVFVHEPKDGLLAVIIQSGGMVLAGVLGFGLAVRELGGRLTVSSKTDFLATLTDGWHLFLSTAAISLYTNTNLVLVGLLAGNVEAGYFSAAEKLVRATTGLISPATQAFFPHVNSLIVQSRDLALRAIGKILTWMAGATLSASVALLILARPLATLLFGTTAAFGCVPILRWIAFIPFLVGISNVLGIQTMLPLKLDRQFSRILLISGVVNLLLGIPLTHYLGAKGAAISVLTTETYVTLAMIFVLQSSGIHLLARKPLYES